MYYWHYEYTSRSHLNRLKNETMVFSSLFQPLFRSPSVRRNFATVVSKEDLVRVVAERHDISLAETRRILSTIFDTVTDVSLVFVSMLLLCLLL